MRHFALLVVAALLVGCVPALSTTPKPPVYYPPADPAEYQPFLIEGTAELFGQAFLMTRGGDTRRCSGQDVYLDPVTSYSRIWWADIGTLTLNAVPRANAQEFMEARRSTKCDADGRFRFSGLPSGSYYLRTRVVWEAPTGSGLMPQGGMLGQEVQIAEGKKVEIILGDKALLSSADKWVR